VKSGRLGHVHAFLYVESLPVDLACDDCARDDPMTQAYGTHRTNKIRASGTCVSTLPEPAKGFTRLHFTRIRALRASTRRKRKKPAQKAFHAYFGWL
jgi:hypothetical protein